MIERDVGSFIRSVPAIRPQATAAATINGAAIDRLGLMSGVVHAVTGAATGTPTSLTYTVNLQDSADGSTGWAAVPDTTFVVSAANAEAEFNVNLDRTRRFIRVVGVVAFVGGTTPNLNIAATVTLGGGSVKPV